jgi:hypothetical protein
MGNEQPAIGNLQLSSVHATDQSPFIQTKSPAYQIKDEAFSHEAGK